MYDVTVTFPRCHFLFLSLTRTHPVVIITDGNYAVRMHLLSCNSVNLYTILYMADNNKTQTVLCHHNSIIVSSGLHYSRL